MPAASLIVRKGARRLGADPYSGNGKFRARHGDPLLLEEVLGAHPKLRPWIMHAGYPMAKTSAP